MSVLSIVALGGAVFVALVWWLNEEDDEDRQAW
jgi:hypothetical protein